MVDKTCPPRVAAVVRRFAAARLAIWGGVGTNTLTAAVLVVAPLAFRATTVTLVKPGPTGAVV